MVDVALTVHLNTGLSFVEPQGGKAALVSAFGRIELPHLSPGARAVLRCLERGGYSERALEAQLLESDGLGAVTWLKALLGQWHAQRLLGHAVHLDGEPLIRLSPTTRRLHLPAVARDGRRYLLSRFAYARRLDAVMVYESPTGSGRVTLHDWRAVALASMWTEARSIEEVGAAFTVVPSEAVEQAFRLLSAAGVLCAAGEAGRSAEDEPPALRQWEFHDLLFHTRTRFGRSSEPRGATFRWAGVLPPPVVAKPAAEGAIELYRPTSPLQSPMTLGEAVELRRSIRSHGEEPITLRQLGEFLYHVDRIRSTTDFHIPGPKGEPLATIELSSRPYPSGGAIHELELYVTVDRCKDLKRGLYHYDPMRHTLALVSEPTPEVEALLRMASQSAAIDHAPQMLITLASRFQRMSWKYSGIAYSATLKNVGSLYQTMYLVATAMGLAPCALGNGDSDHFAKAAGTDYYTETSVGEFMLGSRPKQVNPPPWMSGDWRSNLI